ncbi:MULTISPECIES: hybrid sensor histidine kinase/response regulator [Frankia]|nr:MULTISPECIES: PAS domain S-box protein [Frankia]
MEDSPTDLASGFLEAAPDAIVGVRPDGRIVLVNAQTERLFGYGRDELVGQSIEILVPDAARGAHPAHRRDYLADPRPRLMGAGLELAARRRDGSEFPVEIALSSIDTPDGLIVAAAVRDVTDRIRAEARFRGLLEAAPDAIIGVRPDGRIVLANAQSERLFGYARDELVGQSIEILVPDAVRAAHPAHRRDYLADPQPRLMGVGLDVAARRRDGSEFPAEISLSSIDTPDGLIVAAAVRDVTGRLDARLEKERLRAEAQRGRLESQLHQSQRLESLGQLAGGVAHDFNNLLGVVINYATFVAEEIAQAAAADADKERWSDVQRDIDEILRAADRATTLTHQLLAFGRRETVQPRVIDLNQVVTDMEHLLRRTLGEHIVLQTSLHPDLWPVMADPGQIEQVLTNLAVNARDAMFGGGVLTIDTTNVDADYEYAAERPDVKVGRYTQFRVSDSGTGMSPELVARVFEPFFTTKPKGEGSGLGLATVYGIISQAGGHSAIYSEPGVGTTIRCLLPATTARTVTVDEEATPITPARDGETVLLVEDQSAILEVTRRLLTRNGYQVLTAGSAHDAIPIAAEYPGEIHLLLTDVIMPHMQGKELADRIRTVRPGIRVLYMSGYAHPVLTTQGKLDPGVILLEKPFSEHLLLAKAREALDLAPV